MIHFLLQPALLVQPVPAWEHVRGGGRWGQVGAGVGDGRGGRCGRWEGADVRGGAVGAGAGVGDGRGADMRGGVPHVHKVAHHSPVTADVSSTDLKFC